MSATICWRPTSKNDKHLDVAAPSAFMEKMCEAGMQLPCVVRAIDVPMLRGMAIGFGFEKDRPNPFQELVDLLEHHDSVELWAVY